MKTPKNMPPGADGTGVENAERRAAYLLLPIFTVLALGILAGGIFSYQNYERHFRTGIEQQLVAIAELKVAQIVEWRRQPLMDANYLRRTPDVARRALDVLAQPASPTARQIFTSGLEPLLAGGSYERVILLDAGLKVGLVYPEGASGVLGEAARRAAQQALSSQQVVLADLHEETEGGPVYLSLMVPLVVRRESTGENVPAAGKGSSPADRSAGLLVLQINAQKQLYPLIQFWPMQSRTAETLLVRRDGNDALYLNALRFQTNTALKRRIPLTSTNVPAVKAVLGQAGIVEGIDYRGVAVVAALHAIPDSPWSMVARMDTEEVYAPIRDRLWLTVLLMVALFLGAGASVGLLWRQQRVRFYQERVETADALRTSELRYRRLFEAARDGILILDAETGMVVDVNPFMVELLGVTREVFLGKKVWELGFFKDVVANEANFTELQQKGCVRYEDMALEGYDGHRHEVEFVSNVYLVNHQKVIQCNIRDFSERKQAQAELDRMKGLLVEGQRIAHLGSWEYIAETQETLWSEEQLRIYGLKPAGPSPDYQVMLRHHIHPNDAARLDETFRQCLQDRAVFEQEHRIVRPDGSVRVVQELARPCFDGHARLVKYVGATLDITERRQAEEAQAVQARISAIFASVPDEEMFNEVLNVVLDIMGSPFGVFGFIDEDGASVIPTMTRQIWDKCQIPDKTFRFPRETWGDSTWAHALRDKRTFHSNEPSTNIPEGHVGVRRHISQPILFHGQAIGLFQVANKETDYTAADLQTLEAVAQHVAPLLNARLRREQAQQALAREQDFGRTLLDNLGDGVVACNAQGTLVLFNRVAREWHGMDALALPPEEWGRHYALYEGDGTTPLPTDSIPLLRAFRGETQRDVGMTIVAQSQPPRHILASGDPFYDAQHNLMGAVIVMRDITERKQAEERLRIQAEQLAKSNEELTRANRLMTGRELRAIELKQQVNALAAQLGQSRPYTLAFLDAAAAEVVRTTPKPGEQNSKSLESPKGALL